MQIYIYMPILYTDNRETEKLFVMDMNSSHSGLCFVSFLTKIKSARKILYFFHSGVVSIVLST